jgi:glycosyltransferase involved in cell wall biosynthesis
MVINEGIEEALALGRQQQQLAANVLTRSIKDISLSIVIPVFNSEILLHEVVRRIASGVKPTVRECELILVNDGSRDNSWPLIIELCSQYSWVKGINLMRNYGQHNALLCGIRAARYELTATIDDDLQNPPEEILTLISKLAEGYDIVYGTPQKEQHGFLRDIASQTTKIALQSAMGAEIARNVSSFRVFYTKLRDAFSSYQSTFVSIDVLLTWGTTRFAAVKVRHDARVAGVSNYTFGKLITHALNMMTGFSTLPLQLASVIGFAFTLLGFAVLVYVIGRYLIQGSIVPGFPFLASIIAIFSGAQLFALGIIGEYLARMHFRMMKRPTYAVRATTYEA